LAERLHSSGGEAAWNDRHGRTATLNVRFLDLLAGKFMA
jgi:hypothetical protein